MEEAKQDVVNQEVKVEETKNNEEEKKKETPKDTKKKNRYSSQKKRRRRKPARILKTKNFFVRNGISYVDYRNTKILWQFLDRLGQISPKKFNSLPTKCQRLVALAIKRARQMFLLPYIIVEQTGF